MTGAAAAVRTHPVRATSSWSATSPPAQASTPGRRWRTSGRRCRRRSCRGSRRSTRCRPGRRARSTATPCRGRATSVGSGSDARGWTARRPGCTSSGPTCSAPTSTDPGDDFFDLGGGSLTAAQLVSRLRSRFPEVTVADVYEHPTLGGLAAAARRDGQPRGDGEPHGLAGPAQDPGRAGRVHRPAAHPDRAALAGVDRGRLRTWPRAGSGSGLAADRVVVAGRARLAAPGQPARAGCCSPPPARARSCRGVGPGTYPRGGDATCGSGSPSASPTSSASLNLAGAPALKLYARVLGATVGRHVDLHSVPPVTGLLRLGDGLLDRARGRPGRATGSTATCSTSARSRSAPTPGSARAARSCPGAVVGDGAEVGARLGGLRRGARRGVLVRRPGRPRRRARGPWSDAGRRTTPRWIAGVRRRPRC